MDIKWKDGNNNILNANSEVIKYLNSSNDKMIVLKKEEVKKIVIEDRLMNIFKDFENDLVLTIVIPKGKNRVAVKIFNEYDKTGKMLKGKSSNFLLDLILESSMIAGNPLFGITAFIFIGSVLFLVFMRILDKTFGNIGVEIARILILGYPVYLLLSYIFTRIKRKRIAIRS